MVEKAWFDIGNGRKVYRSIPQPNDKRSDLAMPYFKKDAIEPCQSMADGKWYDSLSALRRTYRADGNPQGKEFVEVGNESILNDTWTPKQATEEDRVNAIRKAEQQVASGTVPPIVDLSDG